MSSSIVFDNIHELIGYHTGSNSLVITESFDCGVEVFTQISPDKKIKKQFYSMSLSNVLNEDYSLIDEIKNNYKILLSRFKKSERDLLNFDVNEYIEVEEENLQFKLIKNKINTLRIIKEKETNLLEQDLIHKNTPFIYLPIKLIEKENLSLGSLFNVRIIPFYNLEGLPKYY